MNETQTAGNEVIAEEDKKNKAPLWTVPVVFGVGVIATLGLLIGMHPTGDSTVWIRLFGHHIVVAHGGSFSTIAEIALLPLAIMLPAWALIHASRTPKSAFTSLGRSKGRWIVLMIIVFIAGDASLLLIPIYYVIRVRPQLNRNPATAPVQPT
jgi:hypothetical protein